MGQGLNLPFMNALAPGVPLIPESAPFTPAQRAWLNGFLAGLYGEADPGAMATISSAEPEDFPWHDPSLELDERLALAGGKPLPRRLMAAMAQLDCGQCGYLFVYCRRSACPVRVRPKMCGTW